MISVKKAVLGTLVALELVAFSSIQAKADIILTFDLSGIFSGISNPNIKIPLFGSIVVDTTSGVVESQTLIRYSAYGQELFSTFTQGYSAFGKSPFIYVVGGTGGTVQELIFFDVLSLIDYTGGNLGSIAHPTLGGSISGFNEIQAPTDIVLIDGTATLEDVPEPSSAGLLVAGIVTLTVTALHRKRNSN